MSSNVRLCRALSQAFDAQARGTDDTIGQRLLGKMAEAFDDAGNALERDEMARLGVIGSQPRELHEGMPD